MKTFVFFDDDLDGWGAAWAVREKLGDGAEYLSVSHGEELPVEELPDEEARVFALDYVAELDTLFEIAESHELVVIDHHKSLLDALLDEKREGIFTSCDLAIDVQESRCYHGSVDRVTTYDEFFGDAGWTLYYDEEHSAATLAWQYFHQSEPPQLLRHIEDRDLWNWDLNYSEEVLLGLESVGVSFDTIGRYADYANRLISAGVSIKSYRQGLVEDVASHAQVADLKVGQRSIRTVVAESPHLQSEIAHQLLGTHSEAEMALVYSLSGMEGQQQAFCALRSRDGDELDVSDVADRLGGGGHSEAAGCAIGAEIDLEHLELEDVEN